MLEKQSSPFINRVHLQRLKQLCRHYAVQNRQQTDIQTLAGQLNCSERNIAKLMKTLSSIGWIHWQPGRGRGHKSELTIVTSFDTALMGVLEMHCKRGGLSEASRYAESFGCQEAFRAHLPHWLSVAQASLQAQNVLVTLVPYQLPQLHPLWAYRAVSRLYIDAMFDTLLHYEAETGRIWPHLAHHYEFRGDQLWLRLRPDVYFHHGEKLTAAHVADCLRDRITQPHPYQAMYRHIAGIDTEGTWIILTLTQGHAMMLQTLAEMHASIYLEQGNSLIPSGTGPFRLGDVSGHHWTLVKNEEYFAAKALIDQADFWSSHSSDSTVRGHIVHHGYAAHALDASVQKPLRTGCEVMEFRSGEDRLSMDEKAWVIHHARVFCELFPTEYAPVANSITGRHQDKPVRFRHQPMRRPDRAVRIFVSGRHKKRSLALIDYLQAQGAAIHTTIQEASPEADYDIAIGGYLVQDNSVFGYYQWLQCSDIFKCSLSAAQQQSLLGQIDQLLRDCPCEADLLDQLYQCEDWLIQQGMYIPLWRDSLSYDIAEAIQGADTDSMGVMSLRKLWFNG